MKLTVLELVQNILSALDSDEVNSITDTAEARQVAQVVETAYHNIIARADLPEHYKIFSLDSSGDADLPVLMTRPSDVRRIEWIKYNTTEDEDEPSFTYVTVLPTIQFVDSMHQMDTTADETESLTYDSHTFYFRNDRGPSSCTILTDNTLVFDAYDSSLESTLQSSKTLCYGHVFPTFSLSNSFTPDLDERQFPLLLNEAKALAFLELKQIAHDQAVVESRRQWSSLQRTKDLTKPNYFDQLPNFSRR